MLRWRWTLSLCSFSVVRFGVLWDSIAKLFQVPNSNNLGIIFVLCRGLQTTNFTRYMAQHFVSKMKFQIFHNFFFRRETLQIVR
jgi:hypothetical protein